MLSSSLFVLSAFELLVQATESYSPLPIPSRRRQIMTCEQTYGNGSIPCGGPESTWCFNPNLGQTCCEREGAFCNGGSYCAPVAGYCCFDDEDLATCAGRAGFHLPNSAVNDYNTNPDRTVATPTRFSRTFIVTPFLSAGPGPTPIDMPRSNTEPSAEPFEEPRKDVVTEFTVTISRACHKTPSSSAPGVVQITSVSVSSSKRPPISASPSTQASASVSPLVRVSIAAKNDGLVGAILVMAVTGVFAILV